MKDIYIIMGQQNILTFYSRKLDIRIDNSEYYDFELDYNSDYDFNSPILPLPVFIDMSLNTTINQLENGTPYIRKRTENGWTADIVFNRDGLPWSSGSTFYYWGISGETIDYNYADNNLSFSFTNDGRIAWKQLKYVPVSTPSGFTNSYKINSGVTPILCEGGTSSDFNVTITFKRYKTLTECGLENEGGLNDLVTTVNDATLTKDWLTGVTQQLTAFEVINKKYYDERASRLGTLKIYLNGNPIYKLENFEEVIPSIRQIKTVNLVADGVQNIFDVSENIGTLFTVTVDDVLKTKDVSFTFTGGTSTIEFINQNTPASGSTVTLVYFKSNLNPLVQSWGTGTDGIDGLHIGQTQFNLKNVEYFEEPLSFLEVKSHYLKSIKPNYEITECDAGLC